MSQDQYAQHLKVIVAEQLQGVPNFTEDINYVAEYIVLLIVNGGDVDSIVKELSTLFDAISVDVLRDVVQTDFFALEALQQGESVDSIVAKIRELNAIQQQQNAAQQQQQQVIPQQPQEPAIPQQPSAPTEAQQPPQPISAFSNVVKTEAVDNNNSNTNNNDTDISMDITPTDYQPRFSGGRGGIAKSRRGRGGSTRGGRGNYNNNNNNHGNGHGRFNPLAKALGMSGGNDHNKDNGNLNFVPKKKEGRCKLFPHCPLGRSCPHAHPTKVCSDYPNCPKPAGTCEFLHPNEDEELMKDIEKTREEFQKRKAALLASRQKPVQTGLVICKFGVLCSNPMCPFGHPTPANEDAKVIDLAWCPNNLKCEDKECRKAHSSLSKIKQVTPIGRPSPKLAVPGMVPAATVQGGFAPKPIEKSLEQCKYGIRCTNKRCKFRHARSPIMCRDGENCTRIDCIFGHPIHEDCRFGINCTNATCLFRHPPERVLPVKGQPTNAAGNNNNTNQGFPVQTPTNERLFALPEGSNIEQAPQQEQPAYQPPFVSQQNQGDTEMN